MLQLLLKLTPRLKLMPWLMTKLAMKPLLQLTLTLTLTLVLALKLTNIGVGRSSSSGGGTGAGAVFSNTSSSWGPMYHLAAFSKLF